MGCCVLLQRGFNSVRFGRYSPYESSTFWAGLGLDMGAFRAILGVKLAMLGGIWVCFSSLGHGFARHFVEMKPTEALHLPI